MRLWSIHPKYLDRIGLVALWRESLLAKAVLEGKTNGYTRHPQLARFYGAQDSKFAINSYLYYVFEEAQFRGYNFDGRKVEDPKNGFLNEAIQIAKGQASYEMRLLKSKLLKRSPETIGNLEDAAGIVLNPIFFYTEGGIASWEKVKNEIL